MKHRKIGYKLSFEQSDKKDNAVTYFVSKTGFTLTMFVFTQIKQNTEMLSYDRHVLKDRRTTFGQIHDKINERVGNLAVCFEKFSHNLRYYDIEIRFEIMLDILVDKRDVDDEFALIEVIFNNVMQFLNYQLDVMSQVLSIFGSYQMYDFDNNLDILALFEDKNNNLAYKSTDITFLAHNVDQVENLLILFH